MDIEASLTTSASVEAVLAHVDDLAAYPKWMSLVHSATRVADAPESTWNVELRASVGPFARSKRLRLVRTAYDHGDTTLGAAHGGDVRRIVFERRETDGRTHAMWRLTVVVTGGGVNAGTVSTVPTLPAVPTVPTAATGGGTNLVMQLHYDGRFFVGVVESILQQHIDAGRKRLSELLAG